MPIGGSVGERGDGGIVHAVISLVEFVIGHQAGFRAGDFAIFGRGNVFGRAGHVPDANLVHAAFELPTGCFFVIAKPYGFVICGYAARGRRSGIQHTIYVEFYIGAIVGAGYVVPVPVIYTDSRDYILADPIQRKPHKVCVLAAAKPPGMVSFGNKKLPVLIKNFHFEPSLYCHGSGEVKSAFIG